MEHNELKEKFPLDFFSMDNTLKDSGSHSSAISWHLSVQLALCVCTALQAPEISFPFPSPTHSVLQIGFMSSAFSKNKCILAVTVKFTHKCFFCLLIYWTEKTNDA